MLNVGKYTLIVTEKPDAALRIASALDVEGKAKRMVDHGVPYYIARRDREIVVVPALGHLYTIATEKGVRSHYPVFSFKWVPRYAVEKDAGRIHVWLEVISKLAKEADAFVDACDYDIEGSVIGYNILKYACQDKEKTAKRMKYSTLTEEELEKAYDELAAHLDFGLVEAGLARHEVDWLYGINLTRALTATARKWSGQYATLSTGRVQGPTLKFLAAREKTIKVFVPTPYWEIKAQIEIADQTVECKYEKAKVETKREAKGIMDSCRKKNGQIVKIHIEQSLQPPPPPFDLGTLQSEAYRLFGYSPKRTASISQQLYLEALISYPRTSSQKLPPTIGYANILKKLNRTPQYRTLSAELLAKAQLRPSEGKKEDPAHPAIFPTGNLPQQSLDHAEKRIWDLVVLRFLAAFGEPALKQTTKACVRIGDHPFHFEGRHTVKQGWLRFYAPYVGFDDIALPTMKEGQNVHVERVDLRGGFTKPPPRYNPGSILKKMEREQIGTKATRAEIAETLQDRKYAKGQTTVLTDLGFEVLEVLEKYCPAVVSVKMTRELEGEMERIQTEEKKKEEVVSEAVEILRPVLERIKQNEEVIGERLSNAVRKRKAEELIIGKCPVCKSGTLMILRSKKSGKRFVGCTNFFKGLCQTSAPLPQRGTVKPLGRSCPACKWPLVQAKMKERHPWTLCLNPKCPRKDRKPK